MAILKTEATAHLINVLLYYKLQTKEERQWIVCEK